MNCIELIFFRAITYITAVEEDALRGGGGKIGEEKIRDSILRSRFNRALKEMKAWVN